MVMTRRFLSALAALSAASVASAAPFASSLDASYVVQLHATRGGFAPPEGGAKMRSQLMTTESGQQFECFLPPLGANSEEKSDGTTGVSDPLSAEEKAEEEQTAAFLSFGRAAAQKVRPQCVQYEDKETDWVYEVCSGLLVRRVSLERATAKVETSVEVQMDATAKVKGKEEVAAHEVENLGAFESDGSRPALTYDQFAVPETQDRVKNHRKPLFTQTFGTGEQQIQVQFICSATSRDDGISAVQWKGDSPKGGPHDIAAFLVGSRVFCDPQHSDADDNDLFTVRSLLQPLADARTCVTRNEGWWTYEFCFGRSLRQYHRDGDGRITAEFSLGAFDAAGNRELERSGSALVSEHIDATHDVSRPAYLELYDHGTFCKEFENHAPRKAKVFYYCSQGGTSHHILTVKETQTCTYTVKVSSPVLCDHPHFLNDEQKSDQEAEILHCIPVEEAMAVATE
ncbi:Protein OS-9 [Phytophthora pseudosyringae]|uniref:Protein OS-9 n=1 Tax=Phytophthora pseudosyringae TaxID=221518 RepID=A0A8T1VYA0_9STRA|nr:Protein OS-9 [Phytophthora pseudosyringae]